MTCLMRFSDYKLSGSISTASSCNFYLIEIPHAGDAGPKAKVSVVRSSSSSFLTRLTYVHSPKHAKLSTVREEELLKNAKVSVNG